MAKEYTDAETIAYLKKKLAAKGGSKKTSGGTRKRKPKGERKKRSGCTYEQDYKDKDGKHTGRPKIWGWRISKQHGFQSFTAYLDKNDGEPRSGDNGDKCRVFVVNIVTEGVGEQTATGVWSKEFRKLSITKLGLVANPFADNGGYFGRGGSRYKDKVK